VLDGPIEGVVRNFLPPGLPQREVRALRELFVLVAALDFL